MRYILDDSGYIDSVSCTPFNCKDKGCTEYTGEIPSGYETLAEWACNANIRAYKIVSNNLVYDAAKDAELSAKWEKAGRIENYSTEEQIIGSWVNGKPIYRKVVDTGALPNATAKYVAHNISNLEEVVSIRGIAFNPTSKNRVTLPYTDTVPQYIVQLFANNTSVILNDAYNQSGFSESFAIVEYTKTTDEVAT